MVNLKVFKQSVSLASVSSSRDALMCGRVRFQENG
jgi:hypothetical protein